MKNLAYCSLPLLKCSFSVVNRLFNCILKLLSHGFGSGKNGTFYRACSVANDINSVDVMLSFLIRTKKFFCIVNSELAINDLRTFRYTEADRTYFAPGLAVCVASFTCECYTSLYQLSFASHIYAV